MRDRSAFAWVNAAFTGDPEDVRNWSRLDPLAPHAQSVAQRADTAGLTEPTARLIKQLGALLFAKSLYTQAEPFYRRALAIDEAIVGPDHPTVAIVLNNLAQLLQATNRLAEAELLMRRALAIDEASLGPDHSNVAIHLNNLALLLRHTNWPVEAEPLMRRHLAIFIDFERKTGHPHPHRDYAVVNYTALLTEMGKSEAEIKAASTV
jgi:tetratricopeptide (TPR) repeat protein